MAGGAGVDTAHYWLIATSDNVSYVRFDLRFSLGNTQSAVGLYSFSLHCFFVESRRVTVMWLSLSCGCRCHLLA
ncbi:hypothetical protein Q31a_56760 [Aureliella helgolandensis]|uniref:Uncharacterized protein n=1 Tax=Aureliella helgolandensis TaxID=2527968 RepID=A0A518GFF4_9BACT|nr:hypothetical protein Q31a_56760 [Aureliella helgolandensis]